MTSLYVYIEKFIKTSRVYILKKYIMIVNSKRNNNLSSQRSKFSGVITKITMNENA